MKILAFIAFGCLLVGGYYLLVWPLFVLALSIINKKFSTRIVSAYLVFISACLIICGLVYRLSPAYPTYIDIPILVLFAVAIYGYAFFAIQYVCYSIFGSPLIGQPKWIGDFVNKNLSGIQAFGLGEKIKSLAFQAFIVTTTVAIMLACIASIIVFVGRIIGFGIPVPNFRWESP